jgi:hypothetical protein
MVFRNTEAYRLLFTLEIRLRELILAELSKAEGRHWWRRRVPSDVRKECLENFRAERSVGGLDHYPHTFLYYANFASLRKILEEKTNWLNVFANIFGRKDIFSVHFTELDALRNKIAHNRLISAGDLQRLKIYINELEQAITPSRCRDYDEHVASLPDIRTSLCNAISMFEDSLRRIAQLDTLPTAQMFVEVTDSWWFEEDALGRSLSPAYDAEAALAEYHALPRGWGAAPKLLDEIAARRITPRIIEGLDCLRGVLRLWPR